MSLTATLPVELEGRLRAVVPEARLVRRRKLRSFPFPFVDGSLPLRLPNERFPELEPAARGELLLLLDPVDLFPRGADQGLVLRHYHRLLFQDAVRGAILRQRYSPEEARQRLERAIVDLTEIDFLEAQDEIERYARFVALSADSFHFAPGEVAILFPTLQDADELIEGWNDDLDLRALKESTRPAGSADLGTLAIDFVGEAGFDTNIPETPPSRLSVKQLLWKADEAAKSGNSVRSALLRTCAALRDGGPNQSRAVAVARTSLRHGLIKKLAPIFGWDYHEERAWAELLTPLVLPAAYGFWPRAARTLYEFQKIATELSGELSILDPVRHLTSFGWKPVRRPLTSARDVILLKRLNAARSQVVKTPLAREERDAITHKIDELRHQVELRFRSAIRPKIDAIFDAESLVAATRDEQVAREKLREELLDRLCEKGMLRFGELRDAVARNRLKLPDVSGPLTFLRGDALLRVDRRLGDELDGVYHPAEIYLRLLHRGTALAFGTPPGRLLSQYVALPFGGAFLTVEFARYLVFEAAKVRSLLQEQVVSEHDAPVLGEAILGTTQAVPIDRPHGPPPSEISGLATLLIGFFLLALIHLPKFRALCQIVVSFLLQGIKRLFVELPARILAFGPLKTVLGHSVVRWMRATCGFPAAVALAVALLLLLLGAGPRRITRDASIVFLAATLLRLTPWGCRWIERWNEFVDDSSRVVLEFFPGLFREIVWLFGELVGLVERGLCAVDERLRFGDAETESQYRLKVVGAALWFPISYVTRFAFHLLLEPQVNPVKHFPVVTVSHKLLLPQIGAISGVTGLSMGVVGAILSAVPGIFGFIAWELKENWRLYRANRSKMLEPVVIGGHGETMRAFLHPGFHSGTLPKLRKKIRSVLMSARRALRPAVVGGFTHKLDVIAEEVRHFAERELASPLRSSAAWHGAAIVVGTPILGQKRIEIPLQLEEESLTICFQHTADGTIRMTVVPEALSLGATPERHAALTLALIGFAAFGGAAPFDQDEWTRWRESVK